MVASDFGGSKVFGIPGIRLSGQMEGLGLPFANEDIQADEAFTAYFSSRILERPSHLTLCCADNQTMLWNLPPEDYGQAMAIVVVWLAAELCNCNVVADIMMSAFGHHNATLDPTSEIRFLDDAAF